MNQTCRWENCQCNSIVCPAAAGCGGMREARHHPGDGAELEGLPAQQETNSEGGSHDGEAGEAAETGAGEETQTETSGKFTFLWFPGLCSV